MYADCIRNNAYQDRLLAFLKTEYGLSSQYLTPAKRGWYGETWRVVANEGEFFLKLVTTMNHRITYQRSFTVLDHLNQHGKDGISRCIKTTSGSFCSCFEDAVLGVFLWVDGENIQNEQTKEKEYAILATVYQVPAVGLVLPGIPWDDSSAQQLYALWQQIADHSHSWNSDTRSLLHLLDLHREKMSYQHRRLRLFAEICHQIESPRWITHGDAGGNLIINGDSSTLVDWDDPLLAPPERDAWFALYWGWDGWCIRAFQEALDNRGLNYKLQPELLAFFTYHTHFKYLSEHLELWLSLVQRRDEIAQKLEDYFKGWMVRQLQVADEKQIR